MIAQLLGHHPLHDPIFDLSPVLYDHQRTLFLAFSPVLHERHHHRYQYIHPAIFSGIDLKGQIGAVADEREKAGLGVGR